MSTGQSGQNRGLPGRRRLLGAALAMPALWCARAVAAVATDPIVDLRDWQGLDLSGRNDATALLRRAAGQIPGSGGTLLLPAGRLTVSGPVRLRSGTTVRGSGGKTEILPIKVKEGFEEYRTDVARAVTKGYAIFINASVDSVAKRDTSLKFSDFVIGPDRGSVAYGPDGRRHDAWNGHLIRLHRTDKVAVERIAFRNADDGVALTACRDTLISECSATNMPNAAFDHWFGGERHVVRLCNIVGCSWGVLVTGAGTENEDGTQSGSHIDRVRVTGAAEAAIMANCLSAGSVVADFKVTDCDIDGGGVARNIKAGIYASGIVLQGDVRRAVIQGNRLQKLSGTPIELQAEGYGPARTPGRPPSDALVEANRISNCSPTNSNGRPSALIVLRGPRHTARENRADKGLYGAAIEVDDSSSTLDRNDIPRGEYGHYDTGRARPRVIAR